MANKEKRKTFQIGKIKINKKFWLTVLNIFVWALIGTSLIIGGLQFADKKSGYKVLQNHTAVVVSDSMSGIHPNNISYLTPDTERINKGDIIRAKEYKNFDKIEILDVVIYMGSDNNLICHRVVDKYEDENGKWVVTKGDANPTIDAPVSYARIHGKVTTTVKGVGKVTMFMQSPYFLVALFGSGFSILLGFLLYEILGNKKKKEVEEAQNVMVEKPQEVKPQTQPVQPAVKPQTATTQVNKPFVNKTVVAKPQVTKPVAPVKPVAKPQENKPQPTKAPVPNKPIAKPAETKPSAQPQPAVVKDKKTGRFVSTKKVNSLLIPLLLLGGSAFGLSSIGDASSLVNIGANDLSFNISLGSVAKTYSIQTYLNSAVNNEYPMQINEDASVEENKIAEYYVSGVSLNKGEVLKAHSSADEYFGTFVHKWSSSISTDDYGNYVVPMTNEYNFYLKLYNDSTSQLYIESTVSTVYFTPSANWKSAGARFAIYLFTDGGGDKWKDLSGGTNDLYYATTEGYEKCIFCRMNGGTTENNWSNKWNQSQDVTINGSEPFNYYVSTDNNGWNDVAYMTR